MLFSYTMLFLTAFPKLINKLSKKALDCYVEEVILSVLLTIANVMLWFKLMSPLDEMFKIIITIIGFLIIESIGLTFIIYITAVLNELFATITERPAATFDSILINIRWNNMGKGSRNLFKFKDAEVSLAYFIEKDNIHNVSNVRLLK